MKIFFMLVRRVPPVPSPVLTEVCEILSRRGFQVHGAIAEDQVARPDLLRVEHDVYVLKSHTELSLSLAGILHAQGARLLNPFLSCTATQDKIVASRLLRAARVPAPRAWSTGDLNLLRGVVETTPLILKPFRGHRGAGLHVVRDPDELAAVPPSPVPLLAQEYVQGSGEDLKIYVVGDEVFGTRKPFSDTSFTQPGRSCDIGDELRDMARRCGQALGLGLYGLDVIESADGPVVVDVNYFPGYKGIPWIAARIADYVEGYALGKQELRTTGPVVETSGEEHEDRERWPSTR